MKHKFLAVLLAMVTAFCMAFSVTACGEKNPDETGKNPPITDPSGGEQGNQGSQSGTQKPNEGEQGNMPTPHVHSFGEWKVTKESTCKEAGTKERSCACGEKETETLPLVGHDFENMTCKWCGIQASLGLEYTLINEDKEYEVSGLGDCKDTDLVITNNYDGKPVTSIGEGAFAECGGLTSITIPSSVIKIGRWAFVECGGLKEIKVDPNNKSYHAKDNCLIETESKALILGCSTSKIPDDGSVISIEEGAFGEIEELTSIVIPDCVIEMGHGTFFGCGGLTAVTIGCNVTFIGEEAFGGCNSLKEVHITDLVAWCKIKFENPTSNPLYYAHHLFMGDNEITILDIPNDVSVIENHAFWQCDGITSVTIPDSVTSIGKLAFYYCSGLNSVTIGKGVTSIEYGAFGACSKLTSITIPSSVTMIGANAFYMCTGLQEAYFENPNGWKVFESEDISEAKTVEYFSDPATAARYLKNSYWRDWWCWKRVG